MSEIKIGVPAIPYENFITSENINHSTPSDFMLKKYGNYVKDKRSEMKVISDKFGRKQES